MRLARGVGATALLLAALAGGAAGQKSFGQPAGLGQEEDPVAVTARRPAEAVPAGGLLEITLALSIDPPWHLYAHDFEGTGTPVAVSLDEAAHLLLEDVRYPAPTVVRFDPILEETLRLLEGAVDVVAAVRVAPEHPVGRGRALLRLDYQACTDQTCQLPAQREFPVAYDVRALAPGEVVAPAPGNGGGAGAEPDAPPGDARAPRGVAEPPASLEQDFLRALEAGELWPFLWGCVALAFVSLLTPCVFPMIPITVSFFAKRGEASGGRGTSYALAYGAGIVATYTGFGVGMAALLGASSLQSVATNPWVNLAIGALFVFFGLSLMGFYDLKPPRFLARRAEAGVEAGRAGYVPVLVMGFVFTVTAFTCTAPIVGTLLAALTAGGSLPLIVVGMLVYSVAFALPFVLLAMFPGALHALPGAGGWMNTVKAVMGFIELVAALKFLSAADLVWNLQLMPRPVLLLLAALLMAAQGLYLLGAFKLPHDAGARRRAVSVRTLVALLSLLAALYFARGMTGRSLDAWTESFLPPAGYGGAAGAHEDELIAWREDLEAAKREAAGDGRPLFLDFTGVTCMNCRKVEKTIFADAAFAEALAQRAVPVRLYTDRQAPPEVGVHDAANRQLMERLGSVTLPLYVLMSADGEVLRRMGYDPSFSVQDFIDFLEVPRR